MFFVCVSIGVIMIVMGLSLFITQFLHTDAGRPHTEHSRHMTKPLSLKRRSTLESKLQTVSASDSELLLNLDGFVGLEPEPESPFAGIKLSDEEIGTCHLEPEIPPVMVLASLEEIKNEERQMLKNIALRAQAMQDAAQTAQSPDFSKPRLLGDTACALGITYFEALLAHRLVPRGRLSATNETNLVIARNALKAGRQSATLSHGAIAQRIGENTVCLFEPLEKKIEAMDKAIASYAELLENKTVFIILENTADVPMERLSHLAPICAQFHIPQTNIFIRQPDDTFVNYIEDVHDYVPSRIDVSRMPESFFSQLLDYVHRAYDEGDTETVMRVMGPIMGDLYTRVQIDRRFSKLLAAQAFNLMGMTNRDLEHDNEAICCFEASLALLRVIEDYEAIKSVQANLGISLALARPITPTRIEQAIRHLNEVTQLNPSDDESFVYLANAYLEQFRLTKKQSLLRYALRSYERAQALAPSHEIASCIAMLKKQIGIRTQVTAASHEAGNIQSNVKTCR